MKLVIETDVLFVCFSVFLFISVILNCLLLRMVYELRQQNKYLCNSIGILSNLEDYNLKLVEEVRSFFVLDSDSDGNEASTIESVLYHK